ncbi:hypothetical protein PHYBLDRAFT_74012 [Phycomyces blakesleeanus NRRL 1555(-)]|uniref:Uncharacterized protein n=1 Tax=Phycomyces blakesleeanus (strain ATCC 8743b / DSM 1359 / FGSC 10004 / NBRC 33097 / NRRL 1555) TaxID=763407 RepID=A0A162WWY2_PHYB8|nr:hypothetical protein PHYBLDRAFT_74012 [Phycomyces blakesleeanus NRRL 1555(-)]OAD71315.1 hypothetical protein PHYBLDRAFT_74012 [Phycomyces blakesleeanus NRRL 1555(-)]|eukprot:XP_018289355.1 hypothetical protein PHYBLDRAFT_74012 [Phycomyces blakesleeanus NRRL 1555(-)]
MLPKSQYYRYFSLTFTNLIIGLGGSSLDPMENSSPLPSNVEINGSQKPHFETATSTVSSNPAQPLHNRRNHLKEMHDRLERFKSRNSVAIRREVEQEEAKVKEEQRRLEDEQRLEVERQLLLQELQASHVMASRNATVVSQAPPPIPMYTNPPFHQINFAQLFSPNSNGFGFPTLVSEKEAIDWLKADGNMR